MKVYEQEYIDEKIGRVIKAYVKQLLIINMKFSSFKKIRYLPDLRSILLDLTDAIEGHTAKRQKSGPTKFQPFNLTEPKPRVIPIPKIVCFN
jgi:hypothetical protein